MQRLAGVWRLERVLRDRELAPSRGLILERLVDTFVGEAKAAVMAAQAEVRAELEVRAHRVCRVHVLLAHEPARLVTADRQERGVGAAETAAQLREQRRVAGVSRVVDLQAANAQPYPA